MNTNGFALLATKAASLKYANLGETIPFVSQLQMDEQGMRPEPTARPAPPPPPMSTPRPPMASRALSALKANKGKAGLAGVGLGTLGLHLYNRASSPMTQQEAPSAPDIATKLPMLVPPVRRLMGPRNYARESLRKTAYNTANGALQRFVAKMSAKYGLRPPAEPLS